MENVIVWVINAVVCDFTVRSYLKDTDCFNTDRVELCEDYRYSERVCSKG